MKYKRDHNRDLDRVSNKIRKEAKIIPLNIPCIICIETKRTHSRSPYCPQCTNNHRPLIEKFKTVKKRANATNRTFDLTIQDIINLHTHTNCTYCLIPVAGSNQQIDRKDNDKGYTLSNCVISCAKCNTFKGNKLSYDEMIAIAKLLKDMRNTNNLW